MTVTHPSDVQSKDWLAETNDRLEILLALNRKTFGREGLQKGLKVPNVAPTYKGFRVWLNLAQIQQNPDRAGF
jgi:hypothetical protein